MAHKVEFRVRYYDTDQMGVANHAHYLRWLEVGRAELLRSIGMPVIKMEKAGCHIVIKEAKVDYRIPARYDDLLTIETRLAELRTKGMRFEYAIKRGKDVIAEAYTVHVCTDFGAKPRDIPPGIRKKLEKATE
jgi:acyl-CoA thioester hydrolase